MRLPLSFGPCRSRPRCRLCLPRLRRAARRPRRPIPSSRRLAAAPDAPPPAPAARRRPAAPSDRAPSTRTASARARPSSSEVDAAINRVVARRPELFNIERRARSRRLRVLRPRRVSPRGDGRAAPGRLLRGEGPNEIGVKIDNSLNDQFHIMVSSGHVRRGEASYRSTCRPAWF